MFSLNGRHNFKKSSGANRNRIKVLEFSFLSLLLEGLEYFLIDKYQPRKNIDRKANISTLKVNKDITSDSIKILSYLIFYTKKRQ